MTAVENYSTTISVADLLAKHLDKDLCNNACRNCSNYGKFWNCPPFESDPLEKAKSYEYASIFAAKVMIPAHTPISELTALLADISNDIRHNLISLEKRTNGMACILAGNCNLCKPLPCTRAEGHACRHIDITRPSLEALGFNLSSIISDLFGLNFSWSSDSFAPPYLILISALFHNHPQLLSAHSD